MKIKTILILVELDGGSVHQVLASPEKKEISMALLHSEEGVLRLSERLEPVEVRGFSPVPCPRFRAGDIVHHGPSGEDWVLANDEENGRVSPSGWPETTAAAKDCRLMEPSSEIDRIHTLQAWAKEGLGYEHESDRRTRTARRQLSSENTQTEGPSPREKR